MSGMKYEMRKKSFRYELQTDDGLVTYKGKQPIKPGSQVAIKEVETHKFWLQLHRWRGQIVIRFGSSTEHWDLRIDEGKPDLFHLVLERNPTETEEVNGYLKPCKKTAKVKTAIWTSSHRFKSGKTIGILDIPTEEIGLATNQEANPTKSTPAYLSLVDKGEALLLDSGSGYRKYLFKGKQLKGTYFLRQEEPGSDFWIMTKSTGPRVEKEIRQAIGSQGGKTRLAEEILRFAPGHEIYLEPFCGGASVFFKKEPSKAEILNDLDPNIVCIYQFLQKASAKELSDFAKRDWTAKEETWERLRKEKPKALSDKAYRAWYLTRFGYQGTLWVKGNFRHEQKGRKPRLSLKRLQTLQKRLKGIKLFRKNGTELLRKYNKSNVFAYVDPPYPRNTRKRELWPEELEWNDEKQLELLQALDSFKGKFILSQRKLDLETKARLRKGWFAKRVKTFMSLGTGGAAPQRPPAWRYEYLISNFPLKETIAKSIEAEIQVPIVKADFTKRIVYIVPLEPGVIDSQNDLADEEEIEKALHLYMAKYRTVGLDHEYLLPRSYPVEGYIAPQDIVYEFQGEKSLVRKGSAVVGIFVGEDKVWEMVKRGECSGVSIKGHAHRAPSSLPLPRAGGRGRRP